MMNRFLILFVFCFQIFHTPLLAAELPEAELSEQEQSSLRNAWQPPTDYPDECWSDMQNLAETRLAWFVEKIKFLNNQLLPVENRVQEAIAIFPYLNPSDVDLPKGLKAKAKEKIQNERFLNLIATDLIYSSLYWDFINRSIVFCRSSTPEIQAEVLPHLVQEIIIFEEFALSDLQEYPEYRYPCEEFYINRAMYNECATLAKLLKTSIRNPTQIVDTQTNAPIDIKTVTTKELKLSQFSEETTNASKNSPYFMEQLIYFRNHLTIVQPQPNFNDPMMKAFQAYVLPASGPEIIEPKTTATPKGSVESSFFQLPKQPKNTKAKTKKPSRRNKKRKAKHRPKRTHPAVVTQDAPAQETTLPSPAMSQEESPSVIIPIIKDKAELPTVVGETAPQMTKASQLKGKEEVTSAVLSLSTQLVKPFVLQRKNIRDIGHLTIEHRDSTGFVLDKKTNIFPFKAKNPACFNRDFLREIKILTHLSPRTDKLPNIAQGAITFFIQTQAGGVQKKTVIFPELFLSGGKFFGRDALSFKVRHKIINGMQDLITPAERQKISDLPMCKKGIPLGIAMEKHIRRQVIEGPWKNNCLDSEAVFLLWLTRQLPTVLQQQVLDYGKGPMNLTHAIVSISSYRDSCPNCQRLIQGFQHRLRDLILNCNIQNLQVDPNFGTLAIVKGLIPSAFEKEPPHIISGAVSLKKSKHTLVCVPDNQ